MIVFGSEPLSKLESLGKPEKTKPTKPTKLKRGAGFILPILSIFIRFKLMGMV
jgi:hypothetical protein